jgi:hypothetical protein
LEAAKSEEEHMNKAAIVVLADTETPGDLSRVVNALTATKEFKDADDDVTLVFDGAATKWVGKLARPESKYRELFDEVKDRIDGACAYCARAFGVADAIRTSGVELIGDRDHHPSVRTLAARGYDVITF